MDGVKFFLTALLLSCLCHCSEVQVPKSVKAIKGSCVVVPCSTSPHTQVNWYKYQSTGYPVVYSENTNSILDEFRGRTSLLGKSNHGSCSLKIDNIRQEDDGISVYVWINPGKIYGDYTEIKVLEPSKTHISVENTQVEGKLFSASCTVRHSCPQSPPLLEWLGLPSVSNEVKTTQDSEGLWVSVARAVFRASRGDHGKRLTCRRMPAGTEASSDALQVLFPPTILSDSACGEKNGVLHCMCWVEAEPNAKISWTSDGRNALLPHVNVTNSSIGRKTVSVMTGPLGYTVTCEAANHLGNDTYQLTGSKQLMQGTGFVYMCSDRGHQVLNISSCVLTEDTRSWIFLTGAQEKQQNDPAGGFMFFSLFFLGTDIGLKYLIMAVIVFVVLGIVVVTVKILKKRKYTGSSGTQMKEQQTKSDLNDSDNNQGNELSHDPIYDNSMAEMSNIYLNC